MSLLRMRTRISFVGRATRCGTNGTKLNIQARMLRPNTREKTTSICWKYCELTENRQGRKHHTCAQSDCMWRKYIEARALTHTKLLALSCPSVHFEQLGSHWTVLMQADIWGSFELSRKFKFHYNLAGTMGTLSEDLFAFKTQKAEFMLEWEMFTQNL